MTIAEMIANLKMKMSSALTKINTALVNKGQSAVATLNEVPAKIEAIETGSDVSGVTAAASDVLSPKVFVDANGNEVAGTIATKTSSDVTASGKTVTTPAGYYASQVSKSVSTATQATPSISISSTGLITASTTQSAGYVTSGTKSATKQLSTQGSKIITPSTSQQTAVASNVYTTGTVYVDPIPSSYVEPAYTYSNTTAYIDPGGSITFPAGVYMPNGYAVIAGDGGYAGATDEAERDDTDQITFNCDEGKGLVGFIVMSDGMEPGSSSYDNITCLAYSDHGHSGYNYVVSIHSNDGNIYTGLTNSEFSHSISDGKIVITTNEESYRFKSSYTYYFLPFYSGVSDGIIIEGEIIG